MDDARSCFFTIFASVNRPMHFETGACILVGQSEAFRLRKRVLFMPWKATILLSVFFGGLLASCSKQRSLPADLAPYENLFDEQSIAEDFVNLKVTPFGRHDLSFEMLVPKDWKEVQLKVPREMLLKPYSNFVPLCRVVAEGEEGTPKIEVQVLKLPLELGLTDFVINYLEGNHLRPLLRRPGRFNGRRVEDVVVSTSSEGRTYMARMTFSMHGDKLFVVVGSCEKGSYGAWARHFGLAAVSFRPRKPAPPFIEKMATYVYPGTPYLEFRHPVSWKVVQPEHLPEGMSGTDLVLQVKDKVFGYIHVKAVKSQLGIDAYEALSRLKKDFEDSGILVGKLLRESELVKGQRSPAFRIQVWQAFHSDQVGELATLIMSDGNTIYALGLLVPPRNQNLLAWMTSWRVFEIVYGDIIEQMERKGWRP
ncbi:MAG: hypothetical protein D6806_13055 [Deltaproteobacteria bacterium]|nr:MAG: hypothetical protein D6806_13055 [Deltaproteobacteria bacterium]